MVKNNYMSPGCYKKLLDELEWLNREERPEVTKLVTWAASNGDRSENADYLYGKKRLREIDRRIRFLTQRLDASMVVDPISIKSSKIQFGATVKLLDENGSTRIFTIVGVDEVETSKGHISWQSPIGKALIGKNVGDEVVVKIPAGESSYEVVEIEYKSFQ